MLVALSVPADNERGPQYMEQVFDALHRERVPLSFEFGRHARTVTLYCRFPERAETTVIGQLRSAYPDARLTALTEDALDAPAGYSSRFLRLRLKGAHHGLKSWHEFVDTENRKLADPIAGLLATLPDDRLHARIMLRTRPASAPRRLAYRMGVLLSGASRPAFSKPGGHLFAVSLMLSVAVPPGRQRFARRKLRQMAGAFGRYDNAPHSRFHRASFCLRSFLLTSRELATLWHPVTATVRTDRMDTAPFRLLEPPAVLPVPGEEPGTALLGRVAFHGRHDIFGIRGDDRFRHLFLVGKTGMGKSTLLLNLAASDIAAGRGVALVDPHGDLADAVLTTVPRHRTNDVVLFDAGDRTHPIAFNPLACRSPEQRSLVVSGVVSAFKKLYGDSWGPRLEYILRNALLALVAQPGTSLASLVRLLSDTAYRRQLVSRVDDPVVRSFWQSEFAKWKPQFQAEAVAPIQNKVGQFMSNPILRSILGQATSRFDLRSVMDGGRLLVVNLSKGRIGEDASAMLGSLLVTKLQVDAMSRADVPEAKRRPFYAYVDEFQNFATDSFATVLSEARKYGLALTLANQYLDQIDEDTLSAVFGNVGSLFAFQVGAHDAEMLAVQFGGCLTPADLVGLPKYTAYVRLLIDGMPSRPFSAETLGPHAQAGNQRPQVIRRTSRHRYARPAEEVDRELASVFPAL